MAIPQSEPHELRSAGSHRRSSIRMILSVDKQIGESPQVQWPALITGNTIMHALPPFAMALQLSVLDLDASSLRRLGHEPHFPLTDLVRIGLDLPSRIDVPAEEHPVGRLVGQHACPAALAAVDATVVEVATNTRLEHRLGDRYSEYVVLGGLESAKSLSEDLERVFDRGLNHDGLFHGRTGCSAAHFDSSGDCSTAIL